MYLSCTSLLTPPSPSPPLHFLPVPVLRPGFSSHTHVADFIIVVISLLAIGLLAQSGKLEDKSSEVGLTVSHALKFLRCDGGDDDDGDDDGDDEDGDKDDQDRNDDGGDDDGGGGGGGGGGDDDDGYNVNDDDDRKNEEFVLEKTPFAMILPVKKTHVLPVVT
eukprot:757563-Hanusia_phi.AAC.3